MTKNDVIVLKLIGFVNQYGLDACQKVTALLRKNEG